MRRKRTGASAASHHIDVAQFSLRGITVAPLEPNLTDRLWVDYNDGQFGHTLLCRFLTASATVDQAMDAVADLWAAVADSWYAVTITGARVAAAHENFSTPIVWTGLGSYGATAMPRVFAPRQFCMLGRTPLGRRWRLFLFGFSGSSPDNYRLARVSGNIVDDAADVLETAHASGIFLGADGQVPTLYPYADFNFNNYYERQARS
jgi:hypothetical protein